MHQHILDRPDSYIGSTKLTTEERFVFDNKTKKITKKIVEYNPGLIKIFDEILVNAIDHTVREKNAKTIKVDIDEKSGEISVFNDGPGVPVVLHKEYNVYIPELIFGNLLTSSNYDDTQQRIVGGVNGLGSKCTNIFSKKFVIETIDAKQKMFYKQEFSENMFKKMEPEIKKTSEKSFTKITFLPDYERFGMKKLTKDTVSILMKRVYDTTACTNKDVSVYLNDKKLGAKDFVSYISMYTDEKVITEKFAEGEMIWEVGVYFTEKPGQVSFVNGIDTYNGGKHVESVLNQIVKKLTTLLETKKKMNDVKPSYIKDRIFLFVRSTIVNPSFTSQSKEYLTTNIKDFGIKVELGENFITKVYKSGIVEDLLSFVKYKNDKALAKVDKTSRKTKLNIPKLDDANFAGTNKSKNCTLILTEGDSAKTFAVSGMSVVGRDYYGIFALKGKVLNVREATQQQLLKNEEVNNLKKIIGLQHGKKYESVESLRYGKVMLLTDADSVTFDTPVLLKDINTEEIITKPICEINQGEWITDQYSGKEYGITNKYLVWSEFGWTRIKSIMRHKVNKPIFRVNTSKGCVDVTEDHSILSSTGEKITINDITLNETELLHNEFVQEKYFDYGIPKELAYCMGYFMADGFCSIDLKTIQKNGTISTNSKWEISCVYKDVLYSLKEIFEKYENNSNTTIFNIREIKRTCPSFSNKEYIYILEVKGNRKQIASKYRNMFYNSLREKQVPKEILNSSIEIQKMFLEGFYAGDGNKSVTGNKTRKFDIQHKTSILGMFQLLQNCGYKPSINSNHKKLNVYTISMSKSNCRPIHRVKKLLDVSNKYKNTYVYDIETENHHFHAGTGNIIVHNCDGIHITGLIMNFFHTWWPDLLEIPGFLINMRTPIIKSIKGKETIEFYSQNDYNEWKKDIDSKKWSVKYYKGLGTSTASEAKDIFKKLDKNKVNYVSDSEDKTKKAILLAFEKKKADDRKRWLQKTRPEEILDFSKKNVTYNDFINKELVQFSLSDIARSIPSIYDGLKPSQRKVLYTLFKKNYQKEIKVAQFGAAVAETTAYHHGEASLFSTIINMAQDYVGSNNVNLLKPNGQFGCLDPDTEVMKFSGESIKAKDVKIGDSLMGDDGFQRKVKAITCGIDHMYKVSFSNGKHVVVNSEHILTFKIKCHKMVKYLPHKMSWLFTYFDRDTKVMKFIDFVDDNFNHSIKDLKARETFIKDYIHQTFTQVRNCDIFDIKVSDYMKIDDETKKFMFAIEANTVLHFDNEKAVFNGYDYGLSLKNHVGKIPSMYKFSEYKQRFNIMKGFFHSFKDSVYTYDDYFVVETGILLDDLINDVIFIMRSIGIYCYREDLSVVVKGKGIYSLLNYYNSDILRHTIKNKPIQLGIKIESIGLGKFNGWELSGNKRFLLSNFVITHNSRISNGKDAASPRYIFTEINDITKKIFNPLDFNVIKYLDDDGTQIEPEYYVPIIPVILVNGTQGIGTGFSTFIPCYNINDILENMKLYMDGKKMEEMHPYYNGFKGKILKNIKEKSYIIYGNYKKINDDTLKITELPIGTSIDESVEYIKALVDDGSFLKDYTNNSTDKEVDIDVVFKDTKLLDSYLKNPELVYKNLKLTKTISTNNMHLFDKTNKIKKYEDALEILKEFMEIRLFYNDKRKRFLVEMYTKNLKVLDSKIRFIEEIIKGSLVVYKQKKEKIIEMLVEKKYEKVDNSYDYLLSLPIYSFTLEKINELKTKHQKNKQDLEETKNKTEKTMLLDDIKMITA